MSKRRIAKRDAYQAELIQGSLYLDENLDYITKTRRLAEAVSNALENDPAYKKNPLRREIATIHGNLFSLEIRLKIRLESKVRAEKRQLAAEEDGWMFTDEDAKKFAIQSICSEDARGQ